MKTFVQANLSNKMASQFKAFSFSQISQRFFSLLVLVAFFFLASMQANAQFTPGNLVVYRVGSGTGSLVNTGSPVFLDEYTTSGTLVQSVALPTAASSGNFPLIASGTAGSEGLISLSGDCRYVLATGYGTTTGGSSLAATTSASVPRVVARVDNAKIVNTTTALTDWASANNPRSVASTDGSNFWIGGAAGGVRFTTLGSTTSTQVNAGSLVNIRQVNIMNGQLYITSATSTGTLFTVASVGSGTQTSSQSTTQTVTPLSGLPNTSSNGAYAFYLATLPAGQVLYIADNASNKLYKYSLVSGTWTANGTVALTGIVGLTGTVSGSTVNLYSTIGGTNATGGGTIYSLSDATGYNTTITASFASKATAATNTAFRGIAFVPLASALSITNPGNQSFCSGSLSSVSFTNTSGSSVAYTISNSTISGLSNGSGTGNISFTPTSTGTATVTATAVYGDKQSTSVSFTITVNTTPSTPTVGNQSACTGGTIPNITATPGTGEAIDWYATSSSPTVLFTGNSFATGQSVGNTYTYYALARNTTTGCSSARTPVTLTLTTTVAPTASISINDSTLYPGQSVIFTGSTNVTNPTYSFYIDGSLVSTQSNPVYSTNTITTAGAHNAYVVITSTNTCYSPALPDTSNIQIFNIDASSCSGTPNATVAYTSANNVCSGGTATLSLTGLGANGGITYQWQTSTDSAGTQNLTTVSGATNATYTPTNITSALWYRCQVTCSNSGITTTSSSVQITITANVTPNVTIATANNHSCVGGSVSYVATPSNGGNTTTYVWYLNNVLSSQTGATYTSNFLANGDSLYAVLTSNYACLTTNTAISNKVSQTVNPLTPLTATITGSVNNPPLCTTSSNYAFNATGLPVGITNASYSFYKNNVLISSTFTTGNISTLANGDVIKLVVSSTDACITGSPLTVTSTQTVVTSVAPSVSIASNNNPICGSGSATFTPSPINGGTPSYVWHYFNNGVESTSTGNTFTINSVSNNDSVYVVMTPSIACVTTPTATSATKVENVVTPSTPGVNISSSPAAVSNTVSAYIGSSISFTATPTPLGSSATYQWYDNGVAISGATSTTYSSSSIANGHSISCKIKSLYNCISNTTGTSADSIATSAAISVAILSNSPFTPGNILVYRTGDGVGNLINTGNPVYLDEYTQSGTLVQSKRLTSTTSNSSNLSLVASGTATSEGSLALNTDGRNVAVPGYWAYTGYASSLTGTASATVNRICELVDMNQNVDTTTKLSDWSTGNNPRCVALYGDSIYVGGGAGGVRATRKGATTSTQVSTSQTNIRVLGIFNGQLYSTSNAFIGSVGSGLPRTSGNTITTLPGLTSLGSVYGSFFASSNILYVSDDGGTGTITKYILRNGSWVSKGAITFDTAAARSITGYVNGSTVTLLASGGGSAATGGNSVVYKITNNLDTLAPSTSYTKIVNKIAANNYIAFRGICFTPTSVAMQPANTTTCINTASSFRVRMTAGSGAVYTYQWQSSANGTSWSNLSNGSIYSGVTDTVLNVTPDSYTFNGTQYRCLITYMSNSVVTSNAATLTVPTTVTPSVTISSVSGSTVCSGSNNVFTALGTNTGSSPVYNWFKNGSPVGSGSSITFTSGTLNTNDTIHAILTANNLCQSTPTAISNIIVLTVKPSPIVGVTTGGTICIIGSTRNVYNSNTSGGGVWTSSNPSVATIATVNGAEGIVTAVAAGVDTITYTKVPTDTSNHCVSTATAIIKVSPIATPNAISATSNSVCAATSLSSAGGASTTVLSTTSTGGTWSTTSSSIASINATTGIVTGKSAGTATFRYTVTNTDGCSAFASYNITVNAIPAVPTIQYATGTSNPQTGTGGAFCLGKTFTVKGYVNGSVPATGNLWTSSNTLVMTVAPGSGTSDGFVSLVGTGSGSITYKYTNPFGCYNSRSITGSVVNTCFAKGVNTVSNEPLSSSRAFTMYPNPARSIVNLQVDKLVGNGQIVIADLYGKQVKTQTLSMGNNTVDVSNLSKGFYLVSILSSEGKTTKKLIVE